MNADKEKNDKLDKLQQWKEMMRRKKLEASGNVIQLSNPAQSIGSANTDLAVPVFLTTPVMGQAAGVEKEMEVEMGHGNGKQNQKAQVGEKVVQAVFVPVNLQQAKQDQQEKQLSQEQLDVEKPGSRYLSENVSKPSHDEEGQVEKQRIVKLNRYLLRDVDKLKQAVANIECSLKGLEYIRRRIKWDKKFGKKIRVKVSQIRDIFDH